MSNEKVEQLSDAAVTAAVERWIRSVVVELDLCPFAQRELDAERVRLAVTDATSEEQLLESLQRELLLLGKNSSTETTLLIHPQVLKNFSDYNQFLSLVDLLLQESGLESIYQVASFHPDYQFAGTSVGDAENFTNRSPFPMLHILREESVARAVASFPDVDQVPQRNIQKMNALGVARLRKLLDSCAGDSQECGDL